MYEDIYPRQPGKEQYHHISFEERILFEIDFEKFIEYHLDIRELVVSRMLVAGYCVAEIARHQGVSRRYITRVVTNLRIKFREFLRQCG